MTVKYLQQTMSPQSCIEYNLGTPVYYTRTTGATIYGDAGRSRPKPIIRTVTPFTFYSHEVNGVILDKTYLDGLGRKRGRVGPPLWVYPSGFRTVNDTDNGTAGLLKALAKNAGSRASYGESFAESKQTWNTLKNLTMQLGKAGMAIKRGDWKAVARALDVDYSGSLREKVEKIKPAKRLSDGYLAFQFGIMPVVEEIRNTAEVYAKGLTERGSKAGNDSGSRPSPLGTEDWKDQNRPSLPVLSSRGGYRGTVRNEKLRNLNELGLLNAPLLAYQLTRMSFIFDWILKVSTILGALTGTAGLSQVTMWRHAVSRRTTFCGPGSNTAFTLNTVTYTGVRTPVISGVPPPSLKALTAGSGNDAGKLVTLAAVFRQQLR